MNHTPFLILIKMADTSNIPKKLSKLNKCITICMSCVFDMSYQKLWRTKSESKTIQKESKTKPGDCVSINQLVSAQSGTIPKMTSFLSNM